MFFTKSDQIYLYYLRLHKVMALRPNLGVIVAGGWAGVESYNGRSKPPGAFFFLAFFCFTPAIITIKRFCEG